MTGSRIARWALVGWLGLAFAACPAQGPYATDALQRGRLVVWVVEPSPPQPPTADQVRATLHTATAGSFGQTAGSVGQSSGSYGRSSSDLPSGATSRPASEVGQTAGSFGNGLGTIATAGTPPGAEIVPGGETPALSRGWSELRRALLASFPDLQVSFVPVYDGDVEQRLRQLRPNAPDAPDVMVGDALGQAYAQRPSLRGAALVPVGVSPYELPVYRPGRPGDIAVTVVMRRALDPDAARAFVVWLRDGRRAQAERNDGGAGDAASVGLTAAEAYLRGGGIGAVGDVQRASFSEALARQAAFGPFFDSRVGASGYNVQLSVLSSAGNARLAVLGLRAIVSSPGIFGVLHPVVVVRKSPEGRWRVLQVSGNVSPGLMEDSVTAFRAVTPKVVPASLTTLRTVTLAAPLDGDSRAGVPELWWDNPGGLRLEVVEWQTSTSGWSGTQLALVPDTEARDQTRVRADFFDGPGVYRWRVWSIDGSGALGLSSWRRLSTLP